MPPSSSTCFIRVHIQQGRALQACVEPSAHHRRARSLGWTDGECGDELQWVPGMMASKLSPIGESSLWMLREIRQASQSQGMIGMPRWHPVKHGLACMHCAFCALPPASALKYLFANNIRGNWCWVGEVLWHCKQGVFAIASYQTANSHLIPWTIPPIHAIRTEGTDQSSQFRGYWLPVHICKPRGLQM